jgi:hypothetical protein
MSHYKLYDNSLLQIIWSQGSKVSKEEPLSDTNFKTY